jgi:hypothetical protein
MSEIFAVTTPSPNRGIQPPGRTYHEAAFRWVSRLKVLLLYQGTAHSSPLPP